MRTEVPRGTRREIRDPLVERFLFVRDRIVTMIVRQISLEVKVVAARAVVHDQAPKGCGQLLCAIVFGAQPSSAVKLFGQVSAPSFVDNGLNNDGRVIPISLDHLVESLFSACGSLWGKMMCVVP